MSAVARQSCGWWLRAKAEQRRVRGRVIRDMPGLGVGEMG